MRLNFYQQKPKTNIVVKYKEKKDYTILITIGTIIFGCIIALICFNVYKNNTCNTIEDNILKYAYEYAEASGLLDLDESDSITVDMADVYGSGYPNVTKGSNICYGTVKFTMVEGKLIKTLNVINCSSCSTEERYGSWKETNSLPSNRIIDVKVAYNYYNAEVFYSKWTSWYPSNKINSEFDSQFKVKLPIDSDDLPGIPSTSEVLKYDVEHNTYYRYRDLTWKWYKTPNNNYTSSWYSEAPSGYSNKDDSTMQYTDWSEWSLNYPDVKSYRSIKNIIGYRWYYLDKDGDKHYYNGGVYTISQPSDEYTKYDASATLYSYRDKTWKWYNGQKRNYYSSYSTTAPYGYTYKDSSMSSYTNWSSWSPKVPTSHDYRSIETDVYYRYRAMYRDVSYLVLDEYLPLTDFESSLGMSLSDIRSDNTKKISYKYTYLYK